jgi:hypothetical protein
MKRFVNWKAFAGIAAVAASTAGCGSVARQGQGAALLVVDSFQAQRGGTTLKTVAGPLISDVITNVTSPPPCAQDNPCPTVFNDFGVLTVRSMPKDITSSTTSPSYMDITLTQYHVSFRRADGRNTPGVDVPYAFDGGLSVTLPPGGRSDVVVELVRHDAKEESPLVELKYNGRTVTTIADVTLYGRDVAGNTVSVSGSITVDFGNFGDF